MPRTLSLGLTLELDLVMEFILLEWLDYMIHSFTTTLSSTKVSLWFICLPTSSCIHQMSPVTKEAVTAKDLLRVELTSLLV